MSEKIILPIKTPKQGVEEALREIMLEREGKQLGLLTRYPKLNIAMRKYFRFNSVNLWAGLSGSGKSYLVNLITEDFLDHKEGQLNSKIDFIPIVLHFCFEMSTYNEILRSCANDLGISYNHLLSSQYNKDTKEYNLLSDEELIRVKEYMKYYSSKNIIFFETAGNVFHIFNTVEHICNTFNSKTKTNGITYKFIVNLDHTLLVERLQEKDALELMANIGKIAIRIRKQFGAMVNLVGQLNNNIESTERLLKNSLHYPQKSDIYAQGQLYNACDTVFVLHQPSMLKLTSYGPAKRDTKGLMHLLVLKARHGNIGSIWFLNLLNVGKIIPYPTSDNIVEEDENLSEL